jgi:hypothetical protein
MAPQAKNTYVGESGSTQNVPAAVVGNPEPVNIDLREAVKHNRISHEMLDE